MEQFFFFSINSYIEKKFKIFFKNKYFLFVSNLLRNIIAKIRRINR